MAYAVLADVQALLPKFTLNDSSTPTATQVEGMITDVAGEVDAVLSSQGLTVPVAEPASFLAFLGLLNALGAAALAAAGMFPSDAQAGPAGTPLAPFLQSRYKGGLDRLAKGQGIPEGVPRSGSVTMRGYLDQHPDEEVDLGDIAEPFFGREKVF